MGIFSQNIRPGLYSGTFEAASGYGGVDAGARIKLEGYQNDMALFTAIIESDFNAARAEHEGSVNEATVITEGTVADIFNKIKEFLKKLWEKVKGMIQSFMVKFAAVFIRDNKQLVKKYHKQIVKQMTDSKRKYDEMEFKMHEGFYAQLTKSVKTPDLPNYASIFNIKQFKSGNTLEELKERIDNLIISLVKSVGININELSELKSELDDMFIGQIETYEGYTSTINSAVESELTTGSKTIKKLEKDKRDTESEIRKSIKEIESAQKEAESMKEGGKKEVATTAANAAYYGAVQVQTLVSDIMTWSIAREKSYLKEVRSLYVKAVSRRATVKEDAELLDDIIDEAVDYDVESMFEADVEADLNDDDLSAELDSIDQLSKDEKCGEGCRK